MSAMVIGGSKTLNIIGFKNLTRQLNNFTILQFNDI